MGDDFNTDRLPRISTALILETVRLETFRDQYGMLQCANRSIGPMRKKLGKVPAAAPRCITDSSPMSVPEFEIACVENARDGARVLLAEMCRKCPYEQCKMKTWGIRAPS